MPWIGFQTCERLANGFQALGQAAIALELLELTCSLGRE